MFKYFSSFVLVLFLLAICASFEAAAVDNICRDGKLDFLQNDDLPIATINIEIAETPKNRAKGLMGRELSDFSNGMLFIFQDVNPRSFWMYNTPTSLDIIFVAEDFRIVNIARETTPMSDKAYRSMIPAKYVVEVKAGFAERYGIKEGAKIRWERFQQ